MFCALLRTACRFARASCAVDLTGQFNCARLAIPHLEQSTNASIINLSSQAGKHGFPLRSAYAAAKWGVIVT